MHRTAACGIEFCVLLVVLSLCIFLQLNAHVCHHLLYLQFCKGMWDTRLNNSVHPEQPLKCVIIKCYKHVKS